MNITDDHLIIMDIFKEANLGVGHYLPTQSLMSEIFKLERPLQDKYQDIVRDLVEAGYLEEHNLGPVLTERGYKLIYGD